MRVNIKYQASDETVEDTIFLPSDTKVESVSPSWPKKILGDQEIVSVIKLPFDPGRNTLYIINDLDRPTPTEKVLRLLSKRYPDALYGDVLVATGAHKVSHPTEALAKTLLGGLSSEFAGRFFVHDATGDQTFFCGITSRGTRVEVSYRLLDYKNVVTIGSVEPHWFAGYTGGRKSLIPGVASFETIRQNHGLALLDGVGPLTTLKNPVFEDLNEGTILILEKINDLGGPEVYSINCVAHNEDIFSISSSTVIESINPLISDVNKIYKINAAPTDIVIAIACAPMDRDLYQATKSFENVRTSLRQKASFILVASCPEGIGPPHFARTMALSKNPDLLKEHLSGEYTLGDHKFKNPLLFIEGGGSLSLVSKNLANPEGSKEIGLFSIFGDINSALDKEINRIEKIKSEPIDLLIITDAVNMVTSPVS